MSSAESADPAGVWPAQWLRGVLDLAVLAVVERGETYGYRVSADLEKAGLGVVKGGTLYPLLARLEDSGAVTATWREGSAGPGRKWYSITTHGRQRLAGDRVQWRAFSQLTNDLLLDPTSSGGPR